MEVEVDHFESRELLSGFELVGEFHVAATEELVLVRAKLVSDRRAPGAEEGRHASAAAGCGGGEAPDAVEEGRSIPSLRQPHGDGDTGSREAARDVVATREESDEDEGVGVEGGGGKDIGSGVDWEGEG
jgi:hypothetical protein